MCIVFSIIGRVCWCSRVTISSMFIDGSSYVSFPRPFILCIHFCRMFWERDEWPSPRDSGSLSYPSLRSLLMWLPSMSDLSWSLLPFVLLVSSSFSFLLLIHHPHLTSCHFFLPRPCIPNLTLHVHCSYTSRYHIIFLHHLVIDITFTLGIIMSMAHELFHTYCILYMRAWVLIIRYLGLVSLHFYHPITLAYWLLLKKGYLIAFN